jgi:tetratricopeptide (TPR) repeat protein
MDAQLQQAERLKKDGNTAYAAGRFQAAAKLYLKVRANRRCRSIRNKVKLHLKAVVAAPDEPTYFSNLSAAFFEAGQYKSCVEAIDSAWRLISQSYSDLETDPKTLNLIRKLSMRAVKSLAQCVASQKELPSEDVLSEIEDLRRAIENLTLNNKEDQALAKELRDLWKEWDINGLKDLSKEDRTRDAREQGWKWAGLPRYKPTPYVLNAFPRSPAPITI